MAYKTGAVLMLMALFLTSALAQSPTSSLESSPTKSPPSKAPVSAPTSPSPETSTPPPVGEPSPAEVQSPPPPKADSPSPLANTPPSVISSPPSEAPSPAIEKHYQPFYRVHRAGPQEKIYFKLEDVKAAIVTCGGLCPGLNDVIRQIFITLEIYGVKKIVGIPFGYRGFSDSDLNEMPVLSHLVIFIPLNFGLKKEINNINKSKRERAKRWKFK